VRVSKGFDERTFTPVARPSYSLERFSKKRTSVETVNSRLDVSFGFERHFIRRQNKMRSLVALA